MELTIESIHVCMRALCQKMENMTWQGINVEKICNLKNGEKNGRSTNLSV